MAVLSLWSFLKWLASFPGFSNFRGQNSHCCCSCSLWVTLMCFFKVEFSENCLLQIWHSEGFRLRCTLSVCLFLWDFVLNFESQNSHLWGLKFSWTILMCLLFHLSVKNVLKQISHFESLFSLWVTFTWWFRSPIAPYSLKQILHFSFFLFFSWIVSQCNFNPFLVRYLLVQIGQDKNSGLPWTCKRNNTEL